MSGEKNLTVIISEIHTVLISQTQTPRYTDTVYMDILTNAAKEMCTKQQFIKQQYQAIARVNILACMAPGMINCPILCACVSILCARSGSPVFGRFGRVDFTLAI